MFFLLFRANSRSPAKFPAKFTKDANFSKNSYYLISALLAF